MNQKPAVIVFDVNETLLNMSPLEKKINTLLKSTSGFRIWFGMLLQYSLVDNSTNTYHNFTQIAGAVLDMAAIALKTDIHEKEKQSALQTTKELTAYDDVAKGLKLLKERGYRLATLTNSPLDTLTIQLQNAKLIDYFEVTLSIDSIKKYKPALETYTWAAEQLNVDPSEVMLVAAHGWDIAGAQQAGMATAFIERDRQSFYPLASKPTLIGKDIEDFATKLITRFV